VLGVLTSAQDSDGNGIPDWLQACGDAYVSAGQACDDGNSIDNDACSNSCLLGLTQSCTAHAQCDSTLCDPDLDTCQACVDDQGSGTDSGCGSGAPTCTTVGAENLCLTCADDQAGLTPDDGCSGATPLCDDSASGGLGACVSCLGAGDCDDSNTCTADSCQAGSCDNTPVSAGTAYLGRAHV